MFSKTPQDMAPGKSSEEAFGEREAILTISVWNE
jgi:hypothetical protein